MKFRLPDGNEVAGRSYEDIVAAMADEKLREPRSMESYRRATARRVSSGYGVIIDSTDDRSFILSLEAAGLMERV
jgi:hypothetical protein